MLVVLAACVERVTALASGAETAAAQAIRVDALRDGVERVAPALADAAQATELTLALMQLQGDLEAGQLPVAAVHLKGVRSLVRAAHTSDAGAMGADLSAIELALDEVDEALRTARSTRAARRVE